VYGASLAVWQRRLTEAADVFAVPSEFALTRLEQLGAPLGGRARVVPSVQRLFASASAAASGRFALAAGRLTPEKGFDDAIRACASAGVPLVVAGDGPQREELQALGGDVRFVGRVSASELAELRREAALAVVPSRYAEILPLAALEAMAAGLPVVAAGAGGLVEAVPGEGLYPPGDVAALAERVAALFGDAAAGERSLEVARARYAPSVVASKLRALYDGRTAAG
jgi:glycosyltransferase involved in cell wall biosynthesis